MVADFADNLAEELDFRLEAQSMDAWVAHMHVSPLGKNIRVPQVYWPHTTLRVLTLEDVRAIKITDYAAIEAAGFQAVKVADEMVFPAASIADDPTVKAIIKESNLTPDQVRKIGSSIVSVKVSGVKP